MNKERKVAVTSWITQYEKNAVFVEPKGYYKRLLEAHTTSDILEDVRIMRDANA